MAEFFAALYEWLRRWFAANPDPDPDPDPAPEPEPTPTPAPSPTPTPAPPAPPAARVYTAAERDAFLTAMGYPMGETGTRAFQRASTWHLYDAAAKAAGPLAQDGVFGAKTTAHALAATAAGYRIAPNFTPSEFDCPCGGKNAGCKVHYVRWQTVATVQYIRDHIVKGPMSILSGYRCPTHNKAVGGRVSPPSEHVDGGAADFTSALKVKPSQLLALANAGTLSHLLGIGFQRSNGYASHVDVSNVYGRNIFGEGTGKAAAK